jgi:hypothetical protein
MLNGKIDPNIILRKGIYDKIAARIILERYLDFHNTPEASKMTEVSKFKEVRDQRKKFKE